MTPSVQHAIDDMAPGQIINPVPNAIYHVERPLVVEIEVYQTECAMDNHKRAYRAKVEEQLRLDAHDSEFSR